ncbi:MAG: hypothetical protein CMF43_00765 [Legionellales bacterium]|nr:hypothetical protein [Legionellales bacterium]
MTRISMLACFLEISHNPSTHLRRYVTMRSQKYTQLVLLISAAACIANGTVSQYDTQQINDVINQQNGYHNTASINPTSENSDEFEKKAQLLETQIEARLSQQTGQRLDTNITDNLPEAPSVMTQTVEASDQLISTDNSGADSQNNQQIVAPAPVHPTTESSIAAEQIRPSSPEPLADNQIESQNTQHVTSQANATHATAVRNTEATPPSITSNTHHQQTSTSGDQHQYPIASVESRKNATQEPVTMKATRRTTVVASESPWEHFLVTTIGVIHRLQSNVQSYFSIIFSRQGIPLLIIMFGSMLLSVVIWFAYSSFKTEQTNRINNLISQDQHINTPEKPNPLAMAYAEESSGDFDVFATSEGVPIKLDLAQAYINMQDIEGAKTVLKDIIAQHRGKVVTTAQEMLKKITS